MKILTSLIRPKGGSATINSVDVVRNPTRALKYVGSLVEDPEPYPFMTVREFITFAANIRGIRNPPIDQLNHTLDLPPLGSKCSKLSKGQKRRVFLGAILAQDPEVLILDEPTAGLDPAESIIFRNLVTQRGCSRHQSDSTPPLLPSRRPFSPGTRSRRTLADRDCSPCPNRSAARSFC